MLLVLSIQVGCVRRRMTIRSNPPGAVVYVDRQRIGVTPVSTNFTYYGTRTVELVKDGYDTVTEQHKFTTPWYEIPGLDFFSENLWPFETRDERILDFQMAAQQSVPPSLVLNRAEQLRGRPTGADHPDRGAETQAAASQEQVVPRYGRAAAAPGQLAPAATITARAVLVRRRTDDDRGPLWPPGYADRARSCR